MILIMDVNRNKYVEITVCVRFKCVFFFLLFCSGKYHGKTHFHRILSRRFMVFKMFWHFVSTAKFWNFVKVLFVHNYSDPGNIFNDSTRGLLYSVINTKNKKNTISYSPVKRGRPTKIDELPLQLHNRKRSQI